MKTRTKIVCTIGPAVSSYEKVLELIDAGMNVARLNFSHGTHDEHLKIIEFLKKGREERKVPLAIMLDTKGPEIRVGKLEGGIITVSKGQKLLLVKEDILGDEKHIPITPERIFKDVQRGMQILFDDGYISSTVIDKTEQGIIIEIQNPGVIKDRKGINIPHEGIGLPAMTDQDVEDIKFGCKHDVDMIAASFICSAAHVISIKKLLVSQYRPDILVISKIESMAGVTHFDSILQVSDGIMIARGDLGVELPLTQVPKLQKMMIRKCYASSKPVVTATQMLESMINNPRPTRAEVSDVANAIYDSTSAVMLSGETAVGKYPIEAVKMMRNIIIEAEKDFNYRHFFDQERKNDYYDIPSAIALAVVKTAYSAEAKAIFAFTNTGSTAKIMSRFRPPHPIIAITPSSKTYHQLAISWGVISLQRKVSDMKEGFNEASHFALAEGIARYGDLVVASCGSFFGITGSTNTMIVQSIGNVLVRGSKGGGKKVVAEIVKLLDIEHKAYETKGRIVVITHYAEKFLSYFKEASGIILQNHPDDTDSEKSIEEVAQKSHISYLTRADGALAILEDGQLVTLDPKKKLVFAGKIE